MSPALMNTGAHSRVLGAPTISLDNQGQISSPLNFSGFIQSDRVSSFHAMNPSNDVNPNFQFTASKPVADKGGFGAMQGLSRLRMVKSKKSQHNREMGSSDARKFDTAFNPFKPGFDDCRGVSSVDLKPGESGFKRVDDGSSMAGVNMMGSGLDGNHGGDEDSLILDEIRKLRLGDEKGSVDANGCMNSINEWESGRGIGAQKVPLVDGSSSSELLAEIKGLHIEDSIRHEAPTSSKGKYLNVSGDGRANFGLGGGGGDRYSSLLSELPNDLKKLNIKEPGVLDVNDHAFASHANKMNNYITSGIEDTITNKMNNLDLKTDSANARIEQAVFGLSNRRSEASYSGGESHTGILDELGKLKIGDNAKGSGFHASLGKSSSQTAVQSEGMGEKSIPEDVIRHSEGPSSVEIGVPQYQMNDGTHRKNQFVFTSKKESLGMPYFEFKSPSPKGTLFTGFHEKVEFSARKDQVKDKLSRKATGRSKEATMPQPWTGENFFSKERSFQYKPETSESYSPMEVSPYQETTPDQSLRETSLTFEGTINLDENHSSNDCQQPYGGIVDEDLICATEYLNINEGKNMKFVQGAEQVSACFREGVGVEISSEESVSAVETSSFKSANEFSAISEQNKEVSPGLNDEAPSINEFHSASSSELRGGIPFTFSASSSVKGQVGPAMRNQKKRNQPKHSLLSDASSTLNFSSISRGSALLNTGMQLNDAFSIHHRKEGSSLRVDITQPPKQDSPGPSTTAFAAKEACEKWRLRGNQAYSSGDLDKAEESYTQGVNCISKSEASRDGLRALMLCYSNRAAIRMSLGRFRDALMDCKAASEIDPNFFRVQVRTANCYLALGEVAEASVLLMKLLRSGTEACVDRKLIVEASESIQKAQKVSQCMDHAAELLRRKTSNDAEDSLQVINEALAISPYSEKLLQMKAEALFMIQMYNEVIQFCKKTLQVAEKNFPLLGADNQPSNLELSEVLHKYSLRVWCCSFIFNSHFYLGRLEEGLDFLEKQTDLRSITDRYGTQVIESLIPLFLPARELFKHKSAGNAAYQAGKHAEAIEHYTAALACNCESRPFAAICFCNRAAAYQALNQIPDAIADCNLAIALDRNYLKAISRRATLFEMIRDYEQAASDLQRLVSLLVKQEDEKARQFGATDRPANSQPDLRQAQMRLALVEEQVMKETPLDFYLILGVEPSATSADLKKAYRKAALRHHPDKACQSLSRGDNVDDALWKEMSEEVQKEADRLFKMIGEAYSVLSDPTKRFRYEEEVRNTSKRAGGVGSSRMRSDGQPHGYQRSSSGRAAWRDPWTSAGNPQNRRFEPSWSSRFH